MHRPRTFNWAVAVRRVGLLAGLAVVLVILVPATAFGKRAKRTIICPENAHLKSFTPKQGSPENLVYIHGKQLGDVDNVRFTADHDGNFINASEWGFSGSVIWAEVPNGAITGPIQIAVGSSCGSDTSIKSFVVH